MTTSATPVHGGGQTGISRLLEAEREWQQQLESARADAVRMTAAAIADSEAECAAFEAELPQIIATRRRELDEETRRAADDLRAQLQREIDCYAQLDEAFIAAMAERIAARAPWLSGPVQGMP